MKSDKITILLNEYNFIKDNLLQSIQTRNSIVSLFSTINTLIIAGISIFIKDIDEVDLIVLSIPFFILFILGLIFIERSIANNQSALWAIHSLNNIKIKLSELVEDKLLDLSGVNLIRQKKRFGIFTLRLKYTHTIIFLNTINIALSVLLFSIGFLPILWQVIVVSIVFIIAYLSQLVWAEKKYEFINPFLVNLLQVWNTEVQKMNDSKLFDHEKEGNK